MNCQRNKFNLQRKYAYLNGAYMSPLLKKVEHAGIKGIKKKRKPFHFTDEDFFHETETVRLLFSQLIDNPEPKRIALIPSVSYGLANVVRNLPFKSGKIILTDQHFPSNVYAWRTLNKEKFQIQFIKPKNNDFRGKSWNEELLRAIDQENCIVSIGHIDWIDGTIFDIFKIRKRLDEVGGLLVIDGTQSIGALPFSIRELKPDALICGAYKWLLGPYSTGAAYYGPVFDNGMPIEESWMNRMNSEDFTTLLDYPTNYKEKALRYEVGQHSNFILVPMLHEAIKQLLRWKPENIQKYCKELMESPIEEIRDMGYTIEEESFRAHHLFGVKVGKIKDPNLLNKTLKKHRVSISIKNQILRISPNVYNDKFDTAKLLKALKEFTLVA